MKNKSDFIPNRQLRRCLSLIKILTRNRFGLAKDEIFEKLREEDVCVPSLRTFSRDLEELRNCGYDISCKKDYRYSLNNREEIVNGAFSFEEIQALQMCRGLFEYFNGTHLKDVCDSAINAVIGAQKTPFKKEDIDESAKNFIVHLGWRHNFSDKNELFDSIVFGVNNSKKLKAEYKQNKEVENIVVLPYKIILYRDSLYLLAKKENDSRGLILYHVSRFESVEEIDENFTKNPDLIRDYEEKLSNSFGIFVEDDLYDIEIRFDKSVESALVERIWHKSQKIETKEDVVVLKLRVYKSGEFMSWVKSWGDMVKGISFEKAAT